MAPRGYADGYTVTIPIRSRVRQGCPLSFVVFDLAIDSVLHAAIVAGTGYGLLGTEWPVLAYADDIALSSTTPDGTRRLLAARGGRSPSFSVELRFNPAKCATLHIGAGVDSRVLSTAFALQDQPIRPLAEGKPYGHLDVPTGFSVCQTPLD